MTFATQGAGGREEHRIVTLLENHSKEVFPYDRSCKIKMFWDLCSRIFRERPDLVIMEGSGSPGGLALILSRLLGRTHYVISSGDAIGPYLSQRYPLLGPIGHIYERILYRLCTGFIGWTPYLAGRAMTFGAPRTMTAAGFAPFLPTPELRSKVRDKLHIDQKAFVFGIAGTLDWNPSVKYCYGLELVKASLLLKRDDIHILIIGDGSGRNHLENLLEGQSKKHVTFTGQLPQNELPSYFAAMDFGSLPQSTNKVGSFRYTTKISEYISAGLPIITGRIPFAYDLDDGWIIRLAGKAPWDEVYINALADFMNHIDESELQHFKKAIPKKVPDIFDPVRQTKQVGSFVQEILADLGKG